MIENPWRALPSSPPYVLPEDQQSVAAFNSKLELPASSRYKIDVETVIPEPFVGAVHTAPVIVLQLNPGHADADPMAHADPEFRAALLANLCHEPTEWPFYFFDPRFRTSTPGGRWWTRITKKLAEVISFQSLARRLAVVEWFPYKSHSYKDGCRVSSQAYGFCLVSAAIQRESLIVVSRSVSRWEREVPALRTYRRKLTLSSVQNPVLTSNNLKQNGKKASAAWNLLISALHRHMD